MGSSRSGAERGQGHVTDEEGSLATVQLRQRGPQKRPDGKAHDKQRDTENGDFGGNVKLLNDLLDATRVGGTGKGDGQRSASLDEGDGPLERFFEGHGIPLVAGDELDQVRRLGCAFTAVVVVQYLLGDAGLVEEGSPV